MSEEINFYPLTYVQKGLLYTEKTFPGTNVGNVAVSFDMGSNIKIDYLNKAIQILINSNAGLRIELIEKDGDVKQYISNEEISNIPVKKFESIEQCNQFLNQLKFKPFKLYRSSLYQFYIWQYGNTAGFFVNCHHIICDAWAARLISDQVKMYYDCINNSKTIDEIEYPSYIDFINKEQSYLNSKSIAKHKKFWYEQCKSLPESNAIFPSKNKSKDLKSERVEFYFDKKLTSKIKDICSNYNTTPFNFLFGSLILLISRITSRNDITLGTLIHNRSCVNDKNTIGMFVNTIPFRMKIDKNVTFIEFLEHLSLEFKKILRNQKYPFQLLLKDLRETNQLSGELFDFIFSFDTLTHQLPITWYYNESEAFPIVMHGTERESADQWKFEIDFQLSKYSRSNILLIKKYFISLIHSITQQPEKNILSHSILSDNEKDIILNEFNDTQVNYPNRQTIHQLFQSSCQNHSEKSAVVSGHTKITYQQLDDQSNTLANILQNRSFPRETLIPVIMNRSLEYVVSILGILKAGYAYLPIAPDLPESRIEEILEDSNADLILTNQDLNETVFKQEMIHVDTKKMDYTKPLVNLNQSSNDLAYVMYTSGSTGKPKGVMIEHQSVIRLVQNTNFIQFQSNDQILLTGAVSFDATTFEIWGALLNGLTLHIVDDHQLLDPYFLETYISRNNISILWLTASLLSQMVNTHIKMFKGLRVLLAGGDVLPKDQVNELIDLYPDLKIVNGYGPTENTTFSTTYPVQEKFEDHIPIGKPIANSTAYIMNDSLNLLPVGVTGELYVGGDGLARGYLNRPELTAERFVEHPFYPNERLYKTGDLARWLPDGNIQFLGRNDHQVKLRGFRIELGEIESQLLHLSNIKECVVLLQKDSNNTKQLYAYVTVHDLISEENIKIKLSSSMPEYMIPNRIVILDKFPMNIHGKVDRNALGKMVPENAKIKSGVLPRTTNEKLLADVWKQVLNQETVYIDDNYFHLGGDSIKAIQLTFELQKIGYKLEVPAILQNPTLKKLVPHLKKEKHEIQQKPVEGKVELAPIQKWFFNQQFNHPNMWNHQLVLRSTESLNADIINKVISHLIEHHDMLRASFNLKDNLIEQFVNPINKYPHNFQCIQLLSQDTYLQAIQEDLQRVNQSLQLDGSLFRIRQYKTKDGDYIAFIMHHLLVDGISWRVLIEDFVKAYSDYANQIPVEMNDKTHSYQYWSERIYTYSMSESLLREKKYWSRVEQKKTEKIETSKTIDKRLNKDMECAALHLSEEDTGKILKKIHFAYNTDMNDILLTALGLALYQWQGISAIAINCEGHGRENIRKALNISRTVGWFTSMYPVVFDFIDPDQDLSYHIKMTKETLRQIPNKGIGYGILKYLSPSSMQEELSYNLMPEISFNYLGSMDTQIQLLNSDIHLSSLDLVVDENSHRPFLLDINAVIWQGRLKIKIAYHREEMTKDSMRLLVELLEEQLGYIIDHCINKCSAELTPSDVGDTSLSLDEFDAIVELVNELPDTSL